MFLPAQRLIGIVTMLVVMAATLFAADRGGAAAAHSGVSKAAIPLVIYKNGNDDSGYIPSGWMGDTGNIHYNGHCSTAHPPHGSDCIRIKYASDSGWGGIVWQNPANNWGDAPGGFDLTGAKTLSFWAKSKHAGQIVTFGYGVIGKAKKYRDTSKVMRKITLTKKWKKYSFKLKGRDMTRIVTGFFFSAGAAGKPFTIYLDNIEYK